MGREGEGRERERDREAWRNKSGVVISILSALLMGRRLSVMVVQLPDCPYRGLRAMVRWIWTTYDLL